MSLKTLGRYEIVKPLGQGAMGVVYEAHDPNIKRAVAIKTIRVDQLSTGMAAEFEARFRCETEAGGRLAHPNIIGVYDAGRDQGLAFMVMELVRGGDLRQQLVPGQPQRFDRSMSVMKELLGALDFAHEQGIVHRDIKPANVMLDLAGRVKLGDFGVAQIADGDVDSATAMRTQGSTVGTLKYLSPEQVSGDPVDGRADLFAAGVVMYQLLTGTKPFEGDSDFAVMQAIVQRSPTRPTLLNLALPPGIDAVVFKALAKNRDDRYASARDFALALRAVTQQAAVGAQAGLLQPRAGQRVSAVANDAGDDDATRLARPGVHVAAAARVARAAQLALDAESARKAEGRRLAQARQAEQTRAAAAAAVEANVLQIEAAAALPVAVSPPSPLQSTPTAAHGTGRVIAFATTAASLALLGGGAWFASRDTLTPASHPPAAASAPTVVARLPVSKPEPIGVTVPLIPTALTQPPSGPPAVLERHDTRASGTTSSPPLRPVPAAVATPPAPPRTVPSAPVIPPAPAVRRSPVATDSAAVPAPPPAAVVPAPAPTPVPAPEPATAVVKPSLAELFERGQKLEATSLRQAEFAYRDAAQQGHGASQKRLWELLLKAGRETEAIRYQKEAWDQKVPGVPEPRSAIRL